MSKPSPDVPTAESDQASGAATAGDRRSADLAEKKAAAEIRKLELEMQKLEREIQSALPADVIREKAAAELGKLLREAEKLGKENRILPNGPWVERFKAIGSLSSVLLAVVALAGLWVSVETSRQAGIKAERDAQRTEREMVSSLIRDLGTGPPTLRANAAGRLGAYLGNEEFRPHAVGSLISALSFESEDQVQGAILQALAPAGLSAREPLMQARKMLNEDIIPLFSKILIDTGRPSEETAAKIGSRQQSMIKITLALASAAHCTAPPCRPDFSRVKSLRGSPFLSYADRLQRADFREASLAEADFYAVDLTGARFDKAGLEATSFIKATLVGAKFDGASMRPIIQNKTPLKKTAFREADLAGASFVDACLSGADFTGSLNLDLNALALAFTAGITIEPERLARLGTLRSHDKCRTVEED